MTINYKIYFIFYNYYIKFCKKFYTEGGQGPKGPLTWWSQGGKKYD